MSERMEREPEGAHVIQFEKDIIPAETKS